MWIGRNAIEGSAGVVNRLQELGKRVYFVTNNGSHTRAEFAAKANNLGINMTEKQIISSASATAEYLKQQNFNKKVYLVGRAGISDELRAVNIQCTAPDEPIPTYYYDIRRETLKLDPDVGAVVVCYDPYFSYATLLKAANYLADPNCLFISTNMDKTKTSSDGIVIPAVAPIVRSIESCTNRTVTDIGKPNAPICSSLHLLNETTPQRTLMIGDSAATDILLGKNCGFQTLLVGSGIQRFNDIQKWKDSNNGNDKKFIPDTYLPKLGDLLPFLE